MHNIVSVSGLLILFPSSSPFWASQVALVVKNPFANAGDMRGRFKPYVKKISWSRKWKTTPMFLPGDSRGQRSLADYSSLDHKESDTTEVAQIHNSAF